MVMEYYYFLIVVVIVLKILFWTCYFYVRSQRMRQTAVPRRFIIVNAQTTSTTMGVSGSYSDRSAIISHAEPLSATSPPPYSEVVKEGGSAVPPSYEQCTNTVPGTAAGAGTTVHSAYGIPPGASGTPGAGASVHSAYGIPPGASGTPGAGASVHSAYGIPPGYAYNYPSGYPPQFNGQTPPAQGGFNPTLQSSAPEQ